ncbi:MAG: extracellular solute-binding protein [Acetobacteraceae bacterium]
MTEDNRAMPWRRRNLVLGGLAASLAGLAGRARAITDDEKSLYELAKKEREVTWYTSQILGETAQRVVAAFNVVYPDVKVNLLRASGQVLYQRVMQEISMNALQADVISLSDTGGQQAELKEAGQFLQYRPKRSAEVMPAFRDIDPDGYYHTTIVALTVMVYNTKLVKPEELPKTWADLADPRWKGRIAIGHPGFSSLATVWVTKMNSLYGWGFMEKLAKNDTQVTRNINDTTTLVTAGERAIGITPAPTARPGVAKGNPIGIIYPEDGSILAASPSGIAKGSKHPNAAKLLMEFLLGPECAKVIVEDYGDSIRADVPSPGGKSLDQIKTVAPSAEESKKMGTLVEPFRTLFGF